MSEERKALESHVHIIRSLIHYHDRMLAGAQHCKRCDTGEQKGKCLTTALIGDAYREALVKSLELLNIEIEKLV